MSETNRAGREPGTERDESSVKKSNASASEMDAETVLVARTAADRSCYHTRACQAVERAHEMREIAVESARRRGLSECKWCAGNVERGAMDRSAYEAAVAEGERRDEEEERELVTDGGETPVWIKSNQGGCSASVYHTDRDCQAVSQASTITRLTLSELRERRPGLSECKWCAGNVEHSYSSRPLYEAALAHDPEDEDRELVTDGGRDVDPRDALDLPDAETLRGVAEDLDRAASAIGALHIDDVEVNRAADLRNLQEDLRAHADQLTSKAESEAER